MSGFYIGVDGKARKVKGGYIGIDGMARKLKKGYIGDENGIARLCWLANSFDPVFANNTWEEIAVACQTNSIPDSWAVGDQKTMTIDGIDYTVDIIGKNHDDYADGSGKAPLTFQLHDCYITNKRMNGSSTTKNWTVCEMRTSTLPAILALMPVEVRNAIMEVNKLVYIGGQSPIFNTSDKLFLLSEIEIFGTLINSNNGEGSQYEYYKVGNNTAKLLGESAIAWWMRSQKNSDNTKFCCVNASGSSSNSHSANTNGVSFAFCF